MSEAKASGRAPRTAVPGIPAPSERDRDVELFDAGSHAPASRSRLKLTVAYDGTDFHGFAAQRDQLTVQGALGEALTNVLRTPVDALGLTPAGRTDAGVHAWGQVVSLDAPADTDVDKLRTAVTRMLAPRIVVRAVECVPDDFDARRSATWRRYRYTIVNRPEPDPFLARYAWWVPDRMDLSLLRLAADPFVGEHDFTAFCRRGPEGSSTVRRVYDSQWLTEGEDGVLRYEIRASAFCWQMVRAIVGTIVEAGTGRCTPGDILRTIRAGAREHAGKVAPAHGLVLHDVGY